jgi:hypothetical protein
MFKDHINSRALEMFQTGQGADCVIEVVPQTDGQEKQVLFCFLLVQSSHFCKNNIIGQSTSFYVGTLKFLQN